MAVYKNELDGKEEQVEVLQETILQLRTSRKKKNK